MMRMIGGVMIGAVAAMLAGCGGTEPAAGVTGDRSTEVSVTNQSPAIADGPDVEANGAVNMTDPTGAEGIEPVLNNSVELTR